MASSIEADPQAPFFYFLKGLNPFEHLAAEDFLLRSQSRWGMAVWVSRPCVVLGNFQNPWREVYWQKCRDQNIWLVRRQSGGGCVYHDEGNLNFSFFGDLEKLDKSLNLSLVRKALHLFDLHLEQNKRNDLFYRQGNHSFKVSGNAFKQTRDRFLHHGTLLIHAQLHCLRDILRPPRWEIETSAIASRRSGVINLKETAHNSKNLTVETIKEALKEVFQDYCLSLGVKSVSVKEVDSQALLCTQTLTDLTSPKWIWGKTPKFFWSWEGHRFYFVQGCLKEIRGEKASRFEFLKGWTGGSEQSLYKNRLDSLLDIMGPQKLKQLKIFFGLV